MGKEEFLVHVSDDNFEQEVIKSEKPVLVDFWAPWCGPCRAIGPVVEDLAEVYKDRVKVAKLNIDDNPKTATVYGVMSIPTIVLFKNGNALDKVVGLVPKDRLEELVKKAL
ncbi:MAG: thioredoxin [Deltaproteobacteria bacterium]|jgi:thioredoxin 1|nr:thioredoxin [Deltaproteobacteria bacterium]